jgi:hypothetical protein
VELTYDGVVFRFVANYFGGTGNDLVLECANIRLLAWGGGSTNYGQLGNGTTTQSNVPVLVSRGMLETAERFTAAGARQWLRPCRRGDATAALAGEPRRHRHHRYRRHS